MSKERQDKLDSTRGALKTALRHVRSGEDMQAQFWLGNATAHCPTDMPELDWTVPISSATNLRKLGVNDHDGRFAIVRDLTSLIAQMEDMS